MPKWNPETERDLLLSLYTAVQPHIDKEVQTSIIANMKEKGHEDVNWDLLRQHLQKLRRKEGTAAAANGGNDKAAPAKKPTKPPKNPGGKRPRKAAPKEEDDDDFDESPTKKVKKENALSPLAGEEDDPLPPAFSTC